MNVLILGLGGMGSAAAAHLAARGARVIGLERYGPAHDRGSSHGHSRMIRQAYFEGPDYVPLLLRAYELWRALERDSGESLLTITGGLMIGSPDSDVVRGSLASARTHGLAHELLDAAEIRRRFPPLTPDDDVVALYEPMAGFLHPERTILAHQRRATTLGATLHFDEPVLSWEANGDRVTVTTTRAAYEADRLVLAPGPWAPQILEDLHLPLTVERQVLYWIDPIGGIEPFRVGRFPVYIWEVSDNVHFYGFPAQDEGPGGVKLAFFYGGAACTPEAIDRTIGEDEIRAIHEVVADRIPSMRGPVLHGSTCMYTLTPDHDFIVGLHPRHANVVIASPCSGHGYKFASVIGEVLADLAIDGATRYPITRFAPKRFVKQA